MFRGVNGQSKLSLGEKETSDKSCPSLARPPRFEDLLISLVGSWFEYIGFKIYSTHWDCKGHSSTHAFPAQLKSWLNYQAYKCLGWLYWTAYECFLYKTIIFLRIQIREFIKILFVNEFIKEIGDMILLNLLKWIHIQCFTSEFNTMNSEYWILLDFQLQIHIMNSCLWNQIHEFRFDTVNFYIWIHILMDPCMNSKSIHLNSYTWFHILMTS